MAQDPRSIGMDVQARSAEQQENDAVNQHETLFVILDSARDAVDLVTLIGAIGLDEELDDLAGEDPERHRRIAAARELAQLPVDQDPSA